MSVGRVAFFQRAGALIMNRNLNTFTVSALGGAVYGGGCKSIEYLISQPDARGDSGLRAAPVRP